jgi:hypothetical protein
MTGAAVSRKSRVLRSGLMSGMGVLVAGVAFFFAAPPQAGEASTSCSDCYIVTPSTSSATAGAGTSDVYAFQVTDNDPHEHLVQLTFTAPADFVITDATGPSGTSVSALPGSAVTLDLPSGAPNTFTVEVTALAPCLAADSEAWGVSGVDSRGETNEVHWSSSPPSVTVTGACGLAFTGQPAETAVNSDILTGFNSTGSPLAVQLLDANNDPLNQADFSATGTPVTVSIQANPAGATLGGTTTQNSSNGVADFGDLQINNAGVGYALAANATGFTGVTSSGFTITGQIQACGTGSCTASQSTATTAASLATSSPGNFATLGLGGVSFSCNHYNAVSDVAAFDVVNSSGVSVTGSSSIVTLTVSPAVVQSTHRPLLFWQVCYASQTPFPAIPFTTGTAVIGGTTYYTGLLLPCFLISPKHPAPCLIDHQLTPAGAVVLKFVALGDPFGHT